jgi:acetyl-CoA carboxylase carboxyl transferase subunit alpha
MVATITGEGGSGGALAIAAANKVLILEHSIYSVIAPESGSSILYRDRAQAPHMARAMKITAEDLQGFGIVDGIIKEPLGGAHADRAAAMQAVGDAVEAELAGLDGLSPQALRRQRAERFYAIGPRLTGRRGSPPPRPTPSAVWLLKPAKARRRQRARWIA